MSDYTDDMMEGIFCETCGVYMGDLDDETWEPPGYPQKCEDCE